MFSSGLFLIKRNLWLQIAQYLSVMMTTYFLLQLDINSAVIHLSEHTEKAKELVKFYGADKVVFGTDFPMWKIGEELQRFSALDLSTEDQAKILYKNACEIFKIDEKKIVAKFEKER